MGGGGAEVGAGGWVGVGGGWGQGVGGGGAEGDGPLELLLGDFITRCGCTAEVGLRKRGFCSLWPLVSQGRFMRNEDLSLDN